ncbi:hypothetical protein MettiDRAFT_1475 [Methanolobus tindarius DSM 2278]|uniref:Uncharacterized protein n=1 Tax=Methanolobus tindarius DSM 2278 TaxID=1090322 RepID=W9DR12_METTI|nr:hypothetical protein [Methanolobus tindarius]ETA68028.1 hypothetical protein MettiDRAFT_1475 [Methanolobus tindarius DSM 2278]
MKTIDFLLKNILAPLIVAFLTPFVISLYSQITTDNWKYLLEQVSFTQMYLFLAVIIFWEMGIILKNRYDTVKRENLKAGALTRHFPIDGYETIFQIQYNGVLWDIRVPKGIDSFLVSSKTVDRIDVKLPPKCPLCKTELEQTRSFIKGYKWKCVSCGFTKRNNDIWHKEAERAKKIAKRKLEFHIDENK